MRAWPWAGPMPSIELILTSCCFWKACACSILFQSGYYSKRRTVGKKDISVFPCSCNPLSAVNIDVFRKIAGARHMTSWVRVQATQPGDMSLIPKLKSRWKERINCRVVFRPPCTLVGVCARAHTSNNKKPRVSVRLSSDFSNNNNKMNAKLFYFTEK